MRKQAKKHFFRLKAKKFCFCFTSFRFEAKMMAVFASFHFRFASNFTFRIDAKQAKKALFSH
jgi:hypothetical protein